MRRNRRAALARVAVLATVGSLAFARTTADAQTVGAEVDPRVQIPFEAPAPLPGEIAGIADRLSMTTLAFTDPSTREHFRAVGPYRIVDWGEGDEGAEFRMQLVGRDADRLGAAHLDIRQRDGELWVVATIRGRDFLVRVD